MRKIDSRTKGICAQAGACFLVGDYTARAIRCGDSGSPSISCWLKVSSAVLELDEFDRSARLSEPPYYTAAALTGRCGMLRLHRSLAATTGGVGL